MEVDQQAFQIVIHHTPTNQHFYRIFDRELSKELLEKIISRLVEYLLQEQCNLNRIGENINQDC
jgi:hypothetical protein